MFSSFMAHALRTFVTMSILQEEYFVGAFSGTVTWHHTYLCISARILEDQSGRSTSLVFPLQQLGTQNARHVQWDTLASRSACGRAKSARTQERRRKRVRHQRMDASSFRDNERSTLLFVPPGVSQRFLLSVLISRGQTPISN